MAAPERVWSSAAMDILGMLLTALAGVFGVAGIGGALVSLAVAGANTSPGDRLLSALLIVLVSLAAALLLLALAAFLRLQMLQVRQLQYAQMSLEKLQQSIVLLQETTGSIPQQLIAADQPMVMTGRPDSAPAGGAQATELLAEVRDLLMMTEAQRIARGQEVREKSKQQLVAGIEQHMRFGLWPQAQALLEQLRALAPADATVEALGERLAAQQQERLREAIAAAHTKIGHLMSITAWQQAEEVARQLAESFPEAPEASELAAQVKHEREAFERENLQRLFMDLKDATEHRQWKRAYQTAEELIRRYPGDKKVEKLQSDIFTLKENADAQERREQEELFKDLLKRQRYEEALAVANGVINKFPTSTAALELNKLVPKVEELIRQENMRRQQGLAVQ